MLLIATKKLSTLNKDGKKSAWVNTLTCIIVVV